MSFNITNKNASQKTPQRSSRLSKYIIEKEISHQIPARSQSKSNKYSKSAKRRTKPIKRRRESRRKSWGRLKRRNETLGQSYIDDYMFVEKSQNKLSIKFMDYGNLFVENIGKQKLNLINKIERYSLINDDLILHTLLTHNIFNDLLQTKRIDLIYNILNVIEKLNGSLYFVGFEKNDGNEFVSKEQNLNNFAFTIFNHRDSIRTLNRNRMTAQQQELKDLYVSKVNRVNEKRSQEFKRSLIALDKYEKYISYKKHFGIDEYHFGDICDAYIKQNCVLRPRCNSKTIEKKHIKNILNYFIHCLHLKEDENIILNTYKYIERSSHTIDVHGCKKIAILY